MAAQDIGKHQTLHSVVLDQAYWRTRVGNAHKALRELVNCCHRMLSLSCSTHTYKLSVDHCNGNTQGCLLDTSAQYTMFVWVPLRASRDTCSIRLSCWTNSAYAVDPVSICLLCVRYCHSSSKTTASSSTQTKLLALCMPLATLPPLVTCEEQAQNKPFYVMNSSPCMHACM